jgi:hypothetical protein
MEEEVSEKIRPVEWLTCPEGQDRSDSGSVGRERPAARGFFGVARERKVVHTALLKRLNKGE